jgi:hypothetical protein
MPAWSSREPSLVTRFSAAARTAVSGFSVLTGWGEGVQCLPVNAQTAARGRRLLPVPTPASTPERLRRATRECVLAVAAVEQALATSRLTRRDLAGPRTALIYASASAYAAANWAFLSGDSEQAVYFPYTAPSAVPGEVTIQFGLVGPFLTFLSGANAGIEALWQATVLLASDQCDRALVLGVETFQECASLFTAGRWLLGGPLVEAAACLILERRPGLVEIGYRAGCGDDEFGVVAPLLKDETVRAAYLCLPTAEGERLAARRWRERHPEVTITLVGERIGTCLACAPLIALLLSQTEAPQGRVLGISRWWDAWAALRWPAMF